MKKTWTALASLLFLGVLIVISTAAHAADTKKSSPAPAKPAARPAVSTQAKPAARPASPVSKPAFGGGNSPKTPGQGTTAGHPTGPSAFSRPAAGNLREEHRPDGSTVRMRPNGQIADRHVRGLDIHHGIGGDRQVRLDRPDHSRVFYDRGRPGYVQRPYAFHGHDFARRTYVYRGRVYSHFYHGYAYRGGYIHVYAPERFYRPAFYGWAYHPWAQPVVFGWGFAGAPWYGYYGAYFMPDPVYASPALWLTDYMLVQNLQAAYAAQAAQGAVAAPPDAMPPADSAAGATSLTPDVKQQIAEEVRSQIALENQEAQQNATQQDINPGSSGIDRMLNDGHTHTLVVASAIDAEDASQNGCTLSEGDVLSLRPPTPPDSQTARLVVLSSKGGRECRPNTTITVVMDDLQEMQNHMRENIDQGLEQLRTSQGKNGIPALPESAQGTPTQAAYAAIAPPDDPNAATQIQQQAQQADQAEQTPAAGGQ